MTRRLLPLGGLAILAVVLNHAAGYGQIALFLWADRYLPVTVPYWGALGSVSHYVLLFLRSMGSVSVPCFLFISGFFATYVARAGQAGYQQWKAVLRRVKSLAVPCVVWSVFIYLGDALQGITYMPLEYGTKILTTGASGHLFFVPLLCSLYLLSPWIVASARRRPCLLLGACALAQGGALVTQYLRRCGITSSELTWVQRATPAWSILWWIIYFALGAVTALNRRKVTALVARYRWPILACTIATWGLNVLESDVIVRVLRENWLASVDTLSCTLFALSALACFVAFSDSQFPHSATLAELSKRSYGVYLVHMSVIDTAARAVRWFTPGVLAYQAFLVPMLAAIGLAVPLLAMAIVRRWAPLARSYRYLFG